MPKIGFLEQTAEHDAGCPSSYRQTRLLLILSVLQCFVLAVNKNSSQKCGQSYIIRHKIFCFIRIGRKKDWKKACKTGPRVLCVTQP